MQPNPFTNIAQHVSSLVSLAKMCKSTKGGTLPAIPSLEKLSPMIDPDIPFSFASTTKLRKDAVVGISAAGWGGVNSHLVLVSPSETRLKISRPGSRRSRFNRQLLQTPRSSVIHQTVKSTETIAALGASNILQTDVNIETDLRAVGLDSLSYTRLVGRIRDLLGPPSIG